MIIRCPAVPARTGLIALLRAIVLPFPVSVLMVRRLMPELALLVRAILLRFLPTIRNLLLLPPMTILWLLRLAPRPVPTVLPQHRRSPLVLNIIQLPWARLLASPVPLPVPTSTVVVSVGVPTVVTRRLRIPTVIGPRSKALSADPVRPVTLLAIIGPAVPRSMPMAPGLHELRDRIDPIVVLVMGVILVFLFRVLVIILKLARLLPNRIVVLIGPILPMLSPRPSALEIVVLVPVGVAAMLPPI